MNPAYLTTRPGKAGGTRYYWQPSTAIQKSSTFRPIRLSDNPREAAAQAEAQNAKLNAWRSGEQPATRTPETLRQLIAHFKRSERYRTRSDNTRRTYDYGLRILSAELGDTALRSLTPKTFEQLYMAMRKTPGKAITVARVARLLLEYARRQDMVLSNPALRPGLTSSAKKGQLWSRQQVQAFVQAADQLGEFEIGTMVMLNEWLGQRKGDILTLRAADYRAGALHKVQSKTGAEVVLPVDMVPALKARLREQLARNTAQRSNLLFPKMSASHAAFDARFDQVREAAKLPQLVFKDLRHTAVTRLAESGCTPLQIAAITGHAAKTCEAIIDRYNIRTARQAEDAFRRRLQAEGVTA